MKRNRNRNHKDQTRMELKYCEHCGSLWLRQSGDARVYCEKCQPKVADLPTPKKRAGRVMLPVGQLGDVPLIENYGTRDESETDEFEFEAAAAGGVA